MAKGKANFFSILQDAKATIPQRMADPRTSRMSELKKLRSKLKHLEDNEAMGKNKKAKLKEKVNLKYQIRSLEMRMNPNYVPPPKKSDLRCEDQFPTLGKSSSQGSSGGGWPRPKRAPQARGGIWGQKPMQRPKQKPPPPAQIPPIQRPKTAEPSASQQQRSGGGKKQKKKVMRLGEFHQKLTSVEKANKAPESAGLTWGQLAKSWHKSPPATPRPVHRPTHGVVRQRSNPATPKMRNSAAPLKKPPAPKMPPPGSFAARLMTANAKPKVQPPISKPPPPRVSPSSAEGPLHPSTLRPQQRQDMRPKREDPEIAYPSLPRKAPPPPSVKPLQQPAEETSKGQSPSAGQEEILKAKGKVTPGDLESKSDEDKPKTTPSGGTATGESPGKRKRKKRKKKKKQSKPAEPIETYVEPQKLQQRDSPEPEVEPSQLPKSGTPELEELEEREQLTPPSKPHIQVEEQISDVKPVMESKSTPSPQTREEQHVVTDLGDQKTSDVEMLSEEEHLHRNDTSQSLFVNQPGEPLSHRSTSPQHFTKEENRWNIQVAQVDNITEERIEKNTPQWSPEPDTPQQDTSIQKLESEVADPSPVTSNLHERPGHRGWDEPISKTPTIPSKEVTPGKSDLEDLVAVDEKKEPASLIQSAPWQEPVPDDSQEQLLQQNEIVKIVKKKPLQKSIEIPLRIPAAEQPITPLKPFAHRNPISPTATTPSKPVAPANLSGKLANVYVAVSERAKNLEARLSGLARIKREFELGIELSTDERFLLTKSVEINNEIQQLAVWKSVLGNLSDWKRDGTSVPTEGLLSLLEDCGNLERKHQNGVQINKLEYLLLKSKVEILEEYKKSRVQLPPDDWGLPAQASPLRKATRGRPLEDEPLEITELPGAVDSSSEKLNNVLGVMVKDEEVAPGKERETQGEVDPDDVEAEGEREHPIRAPIPPAAEEGPQENLNSRKPPRSSQRNDINLSAQNFENDRVQQHFAPVRSHSTTAIFDSQPWFAPVQRAPGSKSPNNLQGYPQGKPHAPETSNHSNVYLPQEPPVSEPKNSARSRAAPAPNYSFEPAPMPMARPIISKQDERGVPKSHIGPKESHGPFQQSSQNPSWSSYPHPKPMDNNRESSPRPQNYEPAPRVYPRSFDSGRSFRGRRPPYQQSHRNSDPSAGLDRSGGGYSFKGGFTVPNPKSQRDLWGGENPNKQLDDPSDRSVKMPNKKPISQSQPASCSKNTPRHYIPPALRPNFKPNFKPYMPKPYQSPYTQEPPILERKKKGPTFVPLHSDAVQRPSSARPPVIRPPQKPAYRYPKYKDNWYDDSQF